MDWPLARGNQQDEPGRRLTRPKTDAADAGLGLSVDDSLKVGFVKHVWRETLFAREAPTGALQPHCSL